MAPNGWIKLHRKFLKWEWFTTDGMVRLFIYLLLSANHEDGKWKGIIIKRGQFLTGRKTLSEQTGLSEQIVRTCIKRLKLTSEITSKATNKYSIITICNYDTYQDIILDTNQQNAPITPNDQPATNQQLTTNKNKKNDKEDITWKTDFEIYKNELRTEFEKLIADKDFINQQEKYHPGIDIKLSIEKACVNYWATEAGWKNKKQARIKDIDWKATLTNAIGLNKVYIQNSNGSKEKTYTNL